MLRDKVLDAMNKLALHGMKSVFDEVLASGIKQRATPEKMLLDLLEVEIGERTAKSIRYRLGLARFPVDKDLDGFNFSTSPVNETQIRSLHQGSYLQSGNNIILVGGTGTGKTHLAISMARQAIKNGKRGRFFNVVDLVNQLEQEKLVGRGGKLAENLCRLDLEEWRAASIPPDLKALRENTTDHYHQPDIRRMAAGIRGQQDDNGAPGQSHSSLRNHRNRE
jgi:DNA replication protein DnaC